MEKEWSPRQVGEDESALILAGGSSRGITQVGTLCGALERALLGKYTFFGGNSVGAINAADLAQYPPEQFEQALEHLKTLWFGIRGNRDIWRGGLLSVLRPLWSNGFADPAPLQRILQRNFDPERVRASRQKLRLSTVDVLSGEYVEFGEAEATWEHVYASAAMPFAFPCIQKDNYYLTDGGVLKVAPISTAIKLGYRKLDIILNAPVAKEKRVKRVEVREVRPLVPYACRILDLILDQQFVQELKVCLLYNRLARAGATDKVDLDVRIFAPSDVVSDELILMDFSKETLMGWYQENYKKWSDRDRNEQPLSLEEFFDKLG